MLPIWLCWGQICNFWLLSTSLAFFTFEIRPNEIWLFGLFWPIRFFMSIWQILRWFLQISGHWQILDSISGHILKNVVGNSAQEFLISCFVVSCFWVYSFRLSSSKAKRFEKFSNGVGFILFMHEICTYFLFQSVLVCFKRVVLYLSCIWLFWYHLALRLIRPFLFLTT